MAGVLPTNYSSCVGWQLIFPGFLTNYCLRKRPANSKSKELLLAFKGRISLTPAILHSSISKQSVHYLLSTGTSHNRLLGFRVTLPPFEVSKETVSNPPDSKTFCCSYIWTCCMFTSLKKTSQFVWNHNKACSCPSHTQRKHHTHNHSTNHLHRCFLLSLCTAYARRCFDRLGASLHFSTQIYFFYP